MILDSNTHRIYVIDSGCNVSFLTCEQGALTSIKELLNYICISDYYTIYTYITRVFGVGSLENNFLYQIDLPDADVTKVVNDEHRFQGFIFNLFLGVVLHNGQIRYTSRNMVLNYLITRYCYVNKCFTVNDILS